MHSITNPSSRALARWTATRDGVVLAVLGAVGFQVLHVAEHVIQLGHWVANPLSTPFLTPWAIAGRDVLAMPIGGGPAEGNELLHLLGNTIFFAGLVAANVLVHMDRAMGAARELRIIRAALLLQGAHLVEHVLLTLTLLIAGEPIGVSTLFGAAMGQAWAGSVRVWIHFVLNAVPTVLAALWVARIGVATLLPRAARSGR